MVFIIITDEHQNIRIQRGQRPCPNGSREVQGWHKHYPYYGTVENVCQPDNNITTSAQHLCCVHILKISQCSVCLTGQHGQCSRLQPDSTVFFFLHLDLITLHPASSNIKKVYVYKSCLLLVNVHIIFSCYTLRP